MAAGPGASSSDPIADYDDRLESAPAPARRPLQLNCIKALGTLPVPATRATNNIFSNFTCQKEALCPVTNHLRPGVDGHHPPVAARKGGQAAEADPPEAGHVGGVSGNSSKERSGVVCSTSRAQGAAASTRAVVKPSAQPGPAPPASKRPAVVLDEEDDEEDLGRQPKRRCKGRTVTLDSEDDEPPPVVATTSTATAGCPPGGRLGHGSKQQEVVIDLAGESDDEGGKASGPLQGRSKPPGEQSNLSLSTLDVGGPSVRQADKDFNELHAEEDILSKCERISRELRRQLGGGGQGACLEDGFHEIGRAHV